MDDIVIRPATDADLDAIESLESRAFMHDRLSRRSLHHHAASGGSVLLVASAHERLVGYALVLLRADAAVGRLYSIAVDPQGNRKGLGRRLLAACEAEVVAHGRVALRLEVRADNDRAIGLYRSCGYHVFGHYENYYADGAVALRLEKPLWQSVPPSPTAPAFFRQAEPSASGGACIAMALSWADRPLRPQPAAPHGRHGAACDPFALTLELCRHGLDARAYASPAIARGAEKSVAAQMEPIHGATVVGAALSDTEFARVLDGKSLVLTFATRDVLRRCAARWVLAHRFREGFVVFNDPLFAELPVDNAPGGRDRVLSMRLFGRMTLREKAEFGAAVVVRKGSMS